MENSPIKGVFFVVFFFYCLAGAFLADPRALQCKSSLSDNSSSPLIKKINKKEKEKEIEG